MLMNAHGSAGADGVAAARAGRPTNVYIPTAAQQPSGRTTNKTKVGGGFRPTLNINVVDKGHPTGNGNAAGRRSAQGGGTSQGTPGGDFTSNEDIRAFAEHVRKQARNRAVERSMDAAQLEARLRNIPGSDGSMSGARARARRVSRYLKLIAAAEKAIAKWATALYSAFEREYEAELIKIGKGRAKAQPTQRFNWR